MVACHMTPGGMAHEMRGSPSESETGASGDCPLGSLIRANPRPTNFERRCELADGIATIIRSIRGTDCTACSAMFSACSPKSLYCRYERVVSKSPEQLAAELCSPNTDCECTLVGEIIIDSVPTIVGIAQLITDPAHQVAEYAVLIADAWQNKGLGSALTDASLELAAEWGVPRFVAEFLPSNMRLIRILSKRRFDLSRDFQENVVSGEKRITGREEAPTAPSCASN